MKDGVGSVFCVKGYALLVRNYSGGLDEETW